MFLKERSPDHSRSLGNCPIQPYVLPAELLGTRVDSLSHWDGADESAS